MLLKDLEVKNQKIHRQKNSAQGGGCTCLQMNEKWWGRERPKAFQNKSKQFESSHYVFPFMKTNKKIQCNAIQYSAIQNLSWRAGFSKFWPQSLTKCCSRVLSVWGRNIKSCTFHPGFSAWSPQLDSKLLDPQKWCLNELCMPSLHTGLGTQSVLCGHSLNECMNEGCPTREDHKGSTDAEKQGPWAAARHSRKLYRGSDVYQVSKEGLGGWARWEGVAQAGGAALQRRGSVNRHADVCARTHAEIEWSGPA